MFISHWLARPWEWDSHENPMGWDGIARITFPMNDKLMIMNARVIRNCELF